VPIAGEDAKATDAQVSCYVPENLLLDWKRERFSLDVTLREIKLNQFDPSRRTALFVEPTPSGYARVNLAELAGEKDAESVSSVRETIPVPAPRNRVRLRPPLEIRDDDSPIAPATSEKRGQRNPKDDLILPVFNLEEVIGAPTPTAPGSPTGVAVNSGLMSPSASIER
jgi:hypothetical protein